MLLHSSEQSSTRAAAPEHRRIEYSAVAVQPAGMQVAMDRADSAAVGRRLPMERQEVTLTDQNGRLDCDGQSIARQVPIGEFQPGGCIVEWTWWIRMHAHPNW